MIDDSGEKYFSPQMVNQANVLFSGSNSAYHTPKGGSMQQGVQGESANSGNRSKRFSIGNVDGKVISVGLANDGGGECVVCKKQTFHSAKNKEIGLEQLVCFGNMTDCHDGVLKNFKIASRKPQYC